MRLIVFNISPINFIAFFLPCLKKKAKAAAEHHASRSSLIELSVHHLFKRFSGAARITKSLIKKGNAHYLQCVRNGNIAVRINIRSGQRSFGQHINIQRMAHDRQCVADSNPSVKINIAGRAGQLTAHGCRDGNIIKNNTALTVQLQCMNAMLSSSSPA